MKAADIRVKECVKTLKQIAVMKFAFRSKKTHFKMSYLRRGLDVTVF